MNDTIRATHLAANDILKFFKSSSFLNVETKGNLFLKLLISLILVLLSSTAAYIVYTIVTAIFSLDYVHFIIVNLVVYIFMFLVSAANKESSFKTVDASDNIFTDDDDVKPDVKKSGEEDKETNKQTVKKKDTK